MTDLQLIDRALMDLRHLWHTPANLVDPEFGRVETSTVLIVDILCRDAEPMSIHQLATTLDVAHSTASRLVDRAETAGAVSRSRATTDARRVVVTATPAGKRLAASSRSFRRRYLEAVLADWQPAERAGFARQLARFAGAVQATPPREDK